MTMRSMVDLLPALRELPTIRVHPASLSFRDMMSGLVGTDRAMYAAEFASAVSLGMWPVFDRFNVDDKRWHLSASLPTWHPSTWMYRSMTPSTRS